MNKSFLVVFIVFLISVIYFFLNDGGLFSFTESWIDIKNGVVKSCLMIDKTDTLVVGDLKKRLDNVAVRFVTDKSGPLKHYLMSDTATKSGELRCLVGWLGDLDVGKAKVFFVNKNNEIITLNALAPMK